MINVALDIDFSTSPMHQQWRKGRDQARGERGRYFALNGNQGEVGVSLKKKKIFFFLFFFGETHFHNASCGYIISRQSTTTASVSPSIKWQ